MTISIQQRGPMAPIAQRFRAYFAPVDRNTGAPTIFDAAKSGSFALNSPPAPWLDAGWISAFKRSSATRFQPLRSGRKQAPLLQSRSHLDATLEFTMHEWGKLQMAIAGGSQHINLLAEDPASLPAPSGSTALSPVATVSGSSATEIAVAAGAVSSFAIGDIIAVDLDYSGTLGYVGSGIPGAYIKDVASAPTDPDFARRITFNVGRVSAKTSFTLLLAQPLIAGPPPSGARIQKVKGFVDREGGSFFQEWSALFVCESETGARVFYYYPRLQSAAAAQESSEVIGGDFDAWSLPARLVALPTTDALDQEQVLCYRSFIPATSAALY
jgi:hypothetical protein